LRRERVAEQIRHELSDIIQQDLGDPRRGWTTVTRVEMSPDLRYAKVFISIYGDDQTKGLTLKILKNAGRFLRGAVGRRLRLREVPDLHFVLDESIERSQRILDILRETEIPPETKDDEPGAQS
jgi:ribosome-binding factor A